MGILDANFNFADQQLIADGTAVISTNVYNAGSAKKLFEGSSRRAVLMIDVTAAGGTTPKFSCTFIGDTAANLTTSPITLATIGPTATIAAADLPVHFEIPITMQATAKQYYGLIFDMTGNADNTATVNATLVMDGQSLGLR